MRAIWTRPAKDHLMQIGLRISRDKPGAARSFTARLKAQDKRIAAHPYSGRIVPEFKNPDLREMVYGNYRIIYRIKDARAEILAVWEGHRQLRLVPPAAGKG